MNITIQDKEYPLQWGMGAIEIYCDKMECDIDGLSLIDVAPTERERLKAITTLIHAAVLNGSEVFGQPCNVTYRQLQAALDDMPQEDFREIMDDFTRSKFLGKTVMEHMLGTAPEEQKKSEALA
jgi:hypothetical protein